jgi:Rap1a immunity proteins
MNITTAFGAVLTAAIAFAAMAQAATPVASEHSANNILPGCRFLVAPKPATITSDVSGWSVGLCSGTIDGILTVAVQQRVAMVARYGNAENVPFCSPPTATREEAIRVVVRYLDAHSELKMEEFGSVDLRRRGLANKDLRVG